MQYTPDVITLCIYTLHAFKCPQTQHLADPGIGRLIFAIIYAHLSWHSQSLICSPGKFCNLRPKNDSFYSIIWPKYARFLCVFLTLNGGGGGGRRRLRLLLNPLLKHARYALSGATKNYFFAHEGTSLGWEHYAAFET